MLLLAAAMFCQMRQPASSAEPAQKARVLFVTQSAGFRHGSVTRKEGKLSPAEVAITQLGQQSGLFDVHCTQDCAADFTRENLKNYDVVMFYTTLDLPIYAAELDYFLDVWLKQKGHGFIGFHSATDTFHEHQPYWEMIGGTFNGHPWGSKNKVTITVHDAEHPGIKPFGKDDFETVDEIYQYRNWQPEKVRVLMSLNMEKCDPKMPYQVPVAWCKEWGQGKMFYNNLGHNEATWTNPTFMKSVEGAVRWVMNLEPGDATPNPEVSKAEDAKAKAVAPPVKEKK
jgi:type 1 glutamine amidotransferase